MASWRSLINVSLVVVIVEYSSCNRILILSNYIVTAVLQTGISPNKAIVVHILE